jgi:apolipoprotein N-acyltransferase
VSLVLPGGNLGPEYCKNRLVPFLEYLPLPEVLEGEIRERNLILPSCHYLPGNKPGLFSVDGTRYGVLICYESMAPEPSASLAREADVLLVVTNDAALRSEFAKEAHFRSAILRAAQFRKPVYQAANTGVTGFIDSTGRVVKRTPPGFQKKAVLFSP